jgi:hypothetical protein
VAATTRPKGGRRQLSVMRHPRRRKEASGVSML